MKSLYIATWIVILLTIALWIRVEIAWKRNRTFKWGYATLTCIGIAAMFTLECWQGLLN